MELRPAGEAQRIWNVLQVDVDLRPPEGRAVGRQGRRVSPDPEAEGQGFPAQGGDQVSRERLRQGLQPARRGFRPRVQLKDVISKGRIGMGPTDRGLLHRRAVPVGRLLPVHQRQGNQHRPAQDEPPGQPAPAAAQKSEQQHHAGQRHGQVCGGLGEKSQAGRQHNPEQI